MNRGQRKKSNEKRIEKREKRKKVGGDFLLTMRGCVGQEMCKLQIIPKGPAA